MTNRMDEAAAASRLMEMAIAHWAGELLLQAAEMSLADKFAGDAPRSADGHRGRIRHAAAADSTASCARSPGLGLLAFAGGDSFRLTDLGAALRTGAPGAARSALIALVGDMVKPAWKEFDHGLLTGDTGVREGPRHGAVPVPAAQPRHGAVLQRDDGRLPRPRAAGGGRGLRLLGDRLAGRRRRRLGQHARACAVAASAT